jgi:anti-sigma factor RsiW
MSDCKPFEADFDDYRDNQLDEQRHRQIASHLSACFACRKQVDQDAIIEQSIRDEADAWAVPEHLWARIKTSADVEAASIGKRLKPQSWVVSAVLVCALVIVGVNISLQSDVKLINTKVDTVASALVSEFHTFVISRRQLDYTNNQPTAIRQWFGNKVDFHVPMPVQAAQLSLVGGRLCNMLDQRVASYMYQSGDAWVSLYIMKSSADKIARGIGKDLMHQGYGYVDWEMDGLRYSLVGDIPAEQLRQIAKSLYSTQSATKLNKLSLAGVTRS